MLEQGIGGGKKFSLSPDVLAKYAHNIEGAIDKSFYVECQFQNGTWYKSRILECRLSQDYNVGSKKDESSYQYYIHALLLNRRNDEWVPYNRIRKIYPPQKIIQETSLVSKSAKKITQETSDDYSEHGRMTHYEIQRHEEATRFKNIPRIQINKYRASCWYYSPYPPFYHNVECLYLCQFCLNFFKLETQLTRHSKNCPLFHPPGNEIYRDQQKNIAVFEIDGAKQVGYSQNLCLLSKLFLDHKILLQDTSIFYFYVLCQIIDNEYHIVGYFSRPKNLSYNLCCILVFPFHQRKGYGKFLISFSYELSLIQQKPNSPQRPLSDLGREAYLSWWTQRLIDYILSHSNYRFTIEDIVKQTGIIQKDIIWTLLQSGILKGDKEGCPCLCIDKLYLQELYKKAGKSGIRVLKDNIHWIV